jgi:pyruvate/2-oxoglutarate dehydrogenase complex dihydrolipoamide acyltransferase (E2) component
MPRETQQVRQMIANLEGGGAQSADPVRQLGTQARAAAQAGRAEEAVAAQEQAVALARAQAGEAEADSSEQREALVRLSVLLYNLSGYCQAAGRHEEAVAALEGVVALDERTGHPDLASDREALEAARRLARMSPEEREALQAVSTPDGNLASGDMRAQIEAQLAQLPPEERAQAEAAARAFLQRWEGMSEEEQAEQWARMQAAGRREQIDTLADQARDGAIAVLRGEAEREPLIEWIERVAGQAAEGEEPGSPWLELAAYLRAVVALLCGERAPEVPARYAGHVAAVRGAMGE